MGLLNWRWFGLASACCIGLGCSSKIDDAPSTRTQVLPVGPAAPAQQAAPATPLPQASSPVPAGNAGCTGLCTEVTLGQGGSSFDLAANPHDGVVVDADGGLSVTLQGRSAAGFIWVANSGGTPATVSKIDTSTQTEVARYAVGAADPSRTSVSMNGDAYAASRAGMGVTKISGLGSECPDTNKDGRITTSSGPTDVLPEGEDDCVLWFRKFDQEVRAVAAQDFPGSSTVEPQLDGPPKITNTPERHYVWVGASTVDDGGGGMGSAAAKPTAYKLDGETGEILLKTEMPRGAYGFALDGRGILWLTGGAYWQGNLAFIDTNRCVDEASCNVAPCTASCSATRCPATCDGAVKGDLMLEPSDTYGITVDCKQRVWLGSSVKRYDPLAPADQRLKMLATPLNGSVAGIAADANGWIWGAGISDDSGGTAILRLDAETLTQSTAVSIPSYAHGVAVDLDGKIWAITREDNVHVIAPGATLTDNAVRPDVVTGLDQPYTYSDMTGVQLRLATNNRPGTYRRIFEGCDANVETRWEDFGWEAETPGKSWVVFHARTANRLEDLDSAMWYSLAASPSNQSQTSLGSVLMLSGQPPGRYVEIRAELYPELGERANQCSSSPSITPRVRSFSVRHQCPPRAPE